MLVSFTGAQSTGKSTLLDICSKAIFENNGDVHRPVNYWVFVPEVTRLIKRTHKVDINEQGTDDTQLLIMNQHHVNVMRYKNDKKNHLLDRCAVDGYVYSLYLHRHGRINDNTWNIVKYMYRHLVPEYDWIFYTHPEDIPVEDDGERSVDLDFRNEIIDIYDNELPFTDFMSNNVNWVELRGTPEQRLEIMLECLEPA